MEDDVESIAYEVEMMVATRKCGSSHVLNESSPKRRLIIKYEEKNYKKINVAGNRYPTVDFESTVDANIFDSTNNTAKG
jgi:hypothetical protein